MKMILEKPTKIEAWENIMATPCDVLESEYYLTFLVYHLLTWVSF